jgi:hypothetical protein
VVKGARAIYILGPITAKVPAKDAVTGEPTEATIIRGFKAIPVFRVEDTEGTPVVRSRLPTARPPRWPKWPRRGGCR